MAGQITSSFGITLEWGDSAGAVSKKVAIKDFPDLGGEPNLLETTTLEDSMKTYITGIQEAQAMGFTCNFTHEDYKAVKDDAKKPKYYKLTLGRDSFKKAFTWKGEHDVFVLGKGVDEVLEMKITVAPTTPIEMES